MVDKQPVSDTDAIAAASAAVEKSYAIDEILPFWEVALRRFQPVGSPSACLLRLVVVRVRGSGVLPRAGTRRLDGHVSGHILLQKMAGRWSLPGALCECNGLHGHFQGKFVVNDRELLCEHRSRFRGWWNGERSEHGEGRISVLAFDRSKRDSFGGRASGTRGNWSCMEHISQTTVNPKRTDLLFRMRSITCPAS